MLACMSETASMDDILEFIEGLGGVLTLRPRPGDGSPEISWGDAFFYYAPDGIVPTGQPFATIVTKDYPDDEGSRLDRPGVFRLNVSGGTPAFVRWTGREPREPAAEQVDVSTADVLFAHPVYARQGWLAVVNPGPHSWSSAQDLLRAAHEAARERYERRASRRTPR
jgi:hypothetical protein